MSEYHKMCKLLVKSKFKVKIKSLATEMKYIKKEMEMAYSWWYGNLYTHAVEVVRKEQRHTLLAYAYVRGLPYKTVENKTKKPPDISIIRRIVKSLDRDHQDLLKLIECWINA